MCYYMLHRLRITPSQYYAMGADERAFVCAAIELRCEAEAREGRKG